MSTIDMTEQHFTKDHNNAKLYIRLRWLGAPLLCTGIALFLSIITTVAHTQDYFLILLGVGSMALGLTTFGINHDTAMALVANHYPDTSRFDPILQKEFEEDLRWDTAKTLALKAHTKTGLLVPFLALLLQSYVFTRWSCGMDTNFATICSGWFL